MKKLLSRIIALLAVLCLLPVAAPAQAEETGFVQEGQGIAYSFSQPGRRYVCLKYKTMDEEGLLTLEGQEGRFTGWLPLVYTQQGKQVRISILTPEQKLLKQLKVAFTPPEGAAQQKPEKGATRKVTDLQLTPGDKAMGWSFTAPGHHMLRVQFSSVMQKGSFLVEPDAQGRFAGELQLPHVSAEDLVTLTVRDLKNGQLAQQAERTLHVPPEVPETMPGGPLEGVVVCIDPGHQRAKIKSSGVPLMPGSKVIKNTDQGGSAQGIITYRRESIAALEISYLLCIALRELGATVHMTRWQNNVGVTNLERAAYAESVGADYMIRIHLNMSARTDADAVYVYIPNKSPYASLVVDKPTYKALGEALLKGMMDGTGVKTGQTRVTDEFVGNNWAKMPVFLVETGFMSAYGNDMLLAFPPYQQRVAQGLAQGVVLMEQVKAGKGN